MGLFKPIWMTDKIAKLDRAVEAVKAINDPAQLAKVARSVPFDGVALEALSRIDDEHTLFEIAMPGGTASSEVRATAFSKVRDRELLLQLMDACRDDVPSEAGESPCVLARATGHGNRLRATDYHFVAALASISIRLNAASA